MKAYPEYKASGIDWLGDIPSHWNIVKGAWCCTFQYGFPADSRFFSNERKGIPLIRIRDIYSHDTEIYYNNSDFTLEYIVNNGDILIGMDGDFNVSRWKGGISLLNQRVCKFEKSDSLIKGFLFYLLPIILKEINNIKYSTTVKHLSVQDLSEMRLPIPPVAEQEAIAAYLDDVTGKIDALISEKRKQMEDIRAYRTSLITETVTRGLNPDAPLRPSGIDWLGDIPEHWITSKLKYYIAITNGSDPKLEGDIAVYGSGGASFRTCGEFKEGPSVLLGRKGTINIPRWIEGKYWNVDTAFDCKSINDYNLRFFYYIALIFDYDKYKSNTAVPSMTQGDYNNFILPVPPLAEQQAIADFLDTKTAKIDVLISELTKQIDELTEYKQAVITEAVTGKVDVRDYKPSN